MIRITYLPHSGLFISAATRLAHASAAGWSCEFVAKTRLALSRLLPANSNSREQDGQSISLFGKSYPRAA
jgi:hypothetical protein